MNITWRFAEEADVKAFAEWAACNSDIPAEDIEAVGKAAHPLTLVVEIDGKPELYLPLLPAVTLAFLGFRPGQDARTKVRALNAMKEAVQQLQQRLGIEDAYVFTKATYPMGKWALKNGFKTKSKDGFTLERTHV